METVIKDYKTIMKNLFLTMLLAVGFLFTTQTIGAQTFNDKSDFYVGYQFTRQDADFKSPSFRFNKDSDLNGVNAGYTYFFKNKNVGVGGEVSADFGSNDTKVYTYLGSVTLKKRSGRFNPFIAGKAGVTHVSVANSLRQSFTTGESGYAYGGAVGLDFKVNDKFSVRLPQVDLLRSNEFGTAQNNLRVGVGLVF